MRFTSKDQLVAGIGRERAALLELLAAIPRARWREPGVWGEGWTVLDLLAHLAEWAGMLLRWHREGLAGLRPQLPAPGYKWSQTPALNRAIRDKHAGRSLEDVWQDFQARHQEILELARALPEEDLLNPGRVAWTGRSTLATYLAGNSSSHDHTAARILKRWLSGRTHWGAARAAEGSDS